jgi:hypothetical protein
MPDEKHKRRERSFAPLLFFQPPTVMPDGFARPMGVRECPCLSLPRPFPMQKMPLSAVAFALLSLTACAAAPVLPAAGHPDSSTADWQPLFADDLSNTTLAKGDHAWVLESPGGHFRADIDRMLFTKDTYENFILDFEFKNAPGTNSGIILFCSDPNNWIPNSIEVQIADDFDPKWSAKPDTRCGAFYGRQKPTAFTVKKPGEWNHGTVACIGTKVQVRLNDVFVNQFDITDFKDAKKNPDGTIAPPWLSKPPAGLPVKGHIGLQGKHGNAPVWYRNVRLHELTAEELKNLK